ncbi:MAG: hypothetical protein WA715_02570 [Candidatus Acidiferrum sp.]
MPDLENKSQNTAEIRGWVKNVIVPALVDEWLSRHKDHNRVASPLVAVAESETMGPVPIGRIVQ